MNSSVAKFELERKLFLSPQNLRTYLRRHRQRTPRGWNLSGRWVATHNQQLELGRRQLLSYFGCTHRPETEAARRQTPMTEPKSISVIPQDLNGSASPVAKYVQRPGKRIALQMLLTKPSQAIDPAAEIGRLHRHQDARLRRRLDHADSHNARLRLAKSGAVVPFH